MIRLLYFGAALCLKYNPKGQVPQLGGPVCESVRFQAELGQLTSASQANTVKFAAKLQWYTGFVLLSHASTVSSSTLHSSLSNKIPGSTKRKMTFKREFLC